VPDAGYVYPIEDILAEINARTGGRMKPGWRIGSPIGRTDSLAFVQFAGVRTHWPITQASHR